MRISERTRARAVHILELAASNEEDANGDYKEIAVFLGWPPQSHAVKLAYATWFHVGTSTTHLDPAALEAECAEFLRAGHSPDHFNPARPV